MCNCNYCHKITEVLYISTLSFTGVINKQNFNEQE